MELCELKQESRRLRRQILDTVYHAGGGHIGGDLSVCDILNVLYNRQMDITPQNWNNPGRDHFIPVSYTHLDVYKRQAAP